MREWLVDIRKEKNMTQRQLANESGVKPSTIGMIENGDRRPSVETAQAIAEVLGFDWNLFFPKRDTA